MVTVLTTIDWALIFALLIFSLAVGFLVKDKASNDGLTGFFVAGRNMRWWFVGTSMVATTFASDTPLAITGWVAQYGIAGNWFWWNAVIGTVGMTVFFARKWRNSEVVTDAELSELRYGGRSAALLRTVKASVNATFINCIVMGWVFAGMAKISEPFMDWQALLGPSIYLGFEAFYPELLIFNTLDNTLTIILLVSVTLIYSAMGGLRAVIITDLVQFTLAMCMAIVLAIMAVQHVGGLESMWQQLAVLYPDNNGTELAGDNEFLSYMQIVSFVPSFDTGVAGTLGIPFSAFVMTLGVLWWTNGAVDGSGFTAQRMYTALDGGEAEKGAIWYAFANFTLRSWPWIIAGVAALIIYPRAEVTKVADDFTDCINNQASCTVEMRECLDNRYQCKIKEYALLYRTEGRWQTVTEPGLTPQAIETEVFKEDRERSYPALLRDVLPPGLTGLALASLMAAFMSTISTQINWGASYMANDVYLRFINPEATSKKLVWVSRISTVGITLLGVYIATMVESIGAMWELFGGMMAGLGLPHLMRWLWWRANAWTEIAGMLTGFSLAFANYIIGQTSGFIPGQMSVLPSSMASHPIHVISWISIAACLAAIAATLLTPPVEESQLRKFTDRVKPIGFWQHHSNGYQPERSLAKSFYCWLSGSVSIYAGVFGIGHLLRLEYAIGLSLMLVCLVTLIGMMRGMNEIDTQRNGDASAVQQVINKPNSKSQT
jgi:Na+/proline symporter